MSSAPSAAFDGQAAQIVPQNVEKLPLYHWCPGSRLLCIGSRDGAAFKPDLEQDEARTFHRALSPELIQVSHEKMHTDALCATYSASFYYRRSLEMMCQVQTDGLCIVSAGYGDEDLLRTYAEHISALLILVGPEPGPLLDALVSLPVHKELLLGIDGEDCTAPNIDWSALQAVHLCALRPHAQPIELRKQWYAAARSFVPAEIPVYDEDHQHSHCACGATLVWRSGGRSRLDALDLAAGRCKECGAAASFVQ